MSRRQRLAQLFRNRSAEQRPPNAWRGRHPARRPRRPASGPEHPPFCEHRGADWGSSDPAVAPAGQDASGQRFNTAGTVLMRRLRARLAERLRPRPAKHLRCVTGPGLDDGLPAFQPRHRRDGHVESVPVSAESQRRTVRVLAEYWTPRSRVLPIQPTLRRNLERTLDSSRV